MMSLNWQGETIRKEHQLYGEAVRKEHQRYLEDLKVLPLLSEKIHEYSIAGKCFRTVIRRHDTGFLTAYVSWGSYRYDMTLEKVRDLLSGTVEVTHFDKLEKMTSDEFFDEFVYVGIDGLSNDDLNPTYLEGSIGHETYRDVAFMENQVQMLLKQIIEYQKEQGLLGGVK